MKIECYCFLQSGFAAIVSSINITAGHCEPFATSTRV